MRTTDILRELVRIRSDFPNEQDIGEYIENILKVFGFTVERQYVQDGRFNVTGSKGEGSAILLYAHTDTVQECSGWTKDPYGAEIIDGKMYGLGAYDMKAGIAAILSAIENREPEGFTLKVAFCVDEENISLGGHKLRESGFLDDVKACIVPEASTTEENPGNLIILGRRGRFTGEIIVEGKSCHACIPENGINAIEDASEIITALKDIRLSEHPRLGRSTLTVLRIEVENDSLTVPGRARIIFDRHLVPPEDIESSINDINSLISGLDIRSSAVARQIDRPTPFLMPYETLPDDKFAVFTAEEAGKVHGSVKRAYGLSAADECIFGNMGIPTIVLPPKGGNEHSRDEWVDIESVERISEIIRNLLSSYTGHIPNT